MRRIVGVTSDGEEIYETMTDNDSMTDYDVKGGSSEADEMEIEPKKINNRSKQLFEVHRTLAYLGYVPLKLKPILIVV